KNKVLVKTADLNWEGRNLEINGNINLLSKTIGLDIDLSTDGISWDNFKKEFLSQGKKESRNKQKKWDLPVSGMVRLNSDYFSLPLSRCQLADIFL
ncbi:unnamed protein product, partial [marine sediment metagenome]